MKHISHAVRRAVLSLMAVVALVAGSLALATPSQASGWMYPQTYWTVSGSNLHVWGQAYVHDYGCGLKDCADGSNHYVQAGRLSGAYASNATRASSSMKFTGVGISVSVSTTGGSAGFSAYNDACSHGWWDGSAYWVSVDFGSAVICKTSTWGWVSTMHTSVTGASRFGSSWSVRSNDRYVQVGA